MGLSITLNKPIKLTTEQISKLNHNKDVLYSLKNYKELTPFKKFAFDFPNEETGMMQPHIFVEEIGYQRRGANSQFYEDGMWSSDCVLKRETLIDHNNKYFYDSDFKENIIDKFVEGKTFVDYC